MTLDSGECSPPTVLGHFLITSVLTDKNSKALGTESRPTSLGCRVSSGPLEQPAIDSLTCFSKQHNISATERLGLRARPRWPIGRCYMHKPLRFPFVWVLIFFLVVPTAQAAGDKNDPAAVSQLIAEGDRLVAKKQFEKAMEAFKKADKVSNHTCA